MLRVFFGLEIPAPQRSSLAVEQFLLPLPKKTDPQDFHLTLCFLGQIPDHEVQAAHEVAERTRGQAFPLTIAGLGLFGEAKPRVAWAGILPSEPLARLQAKLDSGLRRSGLTPDARKFYPHITLGRFDPPAPEVVLRLERGVAMSQLRLEPFVVESFAMFRSHTGVKVGKYEVMMRYPLE